MKKRAKIKNIPPEKNKTETSLQAENISSLEPGAVIQLKDVGLRNLNLDTTIRKKHLIKEGFERRYELEADSGTSTYSLNVDSGTSWDVSITLNKFNVNDLQIKPEQLNKLSEDFSFNFNYQGSLTILKVLNKLIFVNFVMKLQIGSILCWEFSDKEEQFISIEKWSDGSYEAHYSVPIKKSQLQILSMR